MADINTLPDLSDSILIDVRKAANCTDDYDEFFDSQLIMHTNTIFSVLAEVGYSSVKDSFAIKDENATWKDFFDWCTDGMSINMVKTYVCSRVRLIFDPPSNSSHLQALTETIKELEWRLNIAVDP